jgi:KRAB domain-containing zinc finger protein
MDHFMEAVKDLKIKQLAECFMTAGNPFSNREEHAADDDNMSSMTPDKDISKNIDNEYKRSMSRTYHTGGEPGSRLYKCEECEAVFKCQSGLWQHTCKQCEYQTTWKRDLKTHQQSKHEGLKYSCKQCEYQAGDKSALRRHQQSKHEGIKYSCNQCEYQTTWKGDLRTHQQSKHEGLKYFCNQCEYQTGDKSALRKHQQSKHEGVQYSCNQCKYQTAWKAELGRHNRRKHQ